MRYLFTILILISAIVVTGQQGSDTIVDLSRSRINKPVVDSTIAHVDITADPKTGFKDLFAGKPEEEGLNQVQLNPRAITFVEDYMAKK
jgi:hypothetical protein